MEERINEVISEAFQKKLEEKKLTREEAFKLIYYLLYKSKDNPLAAIENISDMNAVVYNESDDLTEALKNLIIQLVLKVHELHLDNVNIEKLIQREEK